MDTRWLGLSKMGLELMLGGVCVDFHFLQTFNSYTHKN